jgi:hypothetical protein
MNWFQGHELLEFARESVILYLEDEDCSTRKAAATCCCKLVAHSLSASSSSQFSSNRPNRMGGAKRRRLVEEVCLRFLSVLLFLCHVFKTCLLLDMLVIKYIIFLGDCIAELLKRTV